MILEYELNLYQKNFIQQLIQNRKSSFNSHYVLNPHEHEHSLQIDNGYDNDTTKRQTHREHYQTGSHECHASEQINLYHSVNGNPPPVYTNNSISGDSEVSSIYTCIFFCGMDGHLSRFCSQMQCLADCGPNNNMLYPHGLPPLVNNNSHDQDVQAVAHYVEKGTDLALNHLLNVIE